MAGRREYVVKELNYVKGDQPHPFPRSGHRMVSHGQDVYVWGGMNTEVPEDHPIYANDPVWAQTNPCFQEMWKFSFQGQRWQLVHTHGEIPRHLVGHGMSISGDIIYVYGGTQIPYGVNNSDQIYSYDIRTREWRRRLSNQIILDEDDMWDPPIIVQPRPLYGQAVVAKPRVTIEFGAHIDDTRIYVFGGASGRIPPEYDDNLFEYNTRTTIWRMLENEPVLFEEWDEVHENAQFTPHSRYRAELALHGDYVYVIGGGDNLNVDEFEVIRAYNLFILKWETFVTISDDNTMINNGYPLGRRSFACAQYRNDFYIIGGTNSYQIFDDIWKLDLETLHWTYICRMPTPLMFHAAAITVDQVLIIFGGTSSLYSTERTGSLFYMEFTLRGLEDLAFVAAAQAGHHKELYDMRVRFPDRYH